jgi:hypothetical protein
MRPPKGGPFRNRSQSLEFFGFHLHPLTHYPQATMNTGNFQARRATVDDLTKLRQFFDSQKLSAPFPEKRLTDFQIVFDSSGKVVGTVGLHLDRQQGRIHALSVASGSDVHAVEGLLWERVQTVSRNHGLFRIWMDSPGWPQQNWPVASPKELERLPDNFGDRKRPWSVLQLKEELVEAFSLDHEFNLFAQSQKEDAERLRQQTKVFKKVAYVFALIFAIGAGYMIFQAVKHQIWNGRR